MPDTIFPFSYTLYGVYVLCQAYISTGMREKQQIKYLFWSSLTGYIGGGANFLLVFNINLPLVNPLGTYAVPLYVLATAYAIVRHQLLDIEVVIKRTLVFAGLAGSVVAVVALATFVSQDVLSRFVAIPRIWSNVFAAAVIAGVYGRLRAWLVNVTDRYLFQKKYDYKELLKTFTDEVMVIVDLRQLVSKTVKTLAETVKLENCGLLLLNKDRRTYDLVAAQGTNGQAVKLEEGEPFITFLRRTHEPIGTEGQPGKVTFPEEVTNRLKQLNARLVLPLSLHDELIGVLSLGKKKSDEKFTKDDLDILLPLARTLAIAISNAQLFEELRQANAHLKVAYERLVEQERLAAAGQFATGMAHEIKNPLTAIKTFTEYLPEKYHDPAFREKFFRIVRAEVERINTLVQDLMHFAKPAPLQLELVSVKRLLEDVLTLLSSQCLKQGVQVATVFQDDGRLIHADPAQLKQVFLNLLLNSLEAMPSGGQLEVRTEEQGSRLIIRVRDTGCGIPEECQPKLFDPFFTTKERGMGLGLAIVKGVVERHGGQITVTSQPGQGTTVEVSLPTSSAAMSESRFGR